MRQTQQRAYRATITVVLLGALLCGAGHAARDLAAKADLSRPQFATRAPNSTIDGWVAKAQARVRARPDDPQAHRALATAYMRKQRESGDPAYYDRAEAALRKALALEPDGYETRKLLAWVLAGKHEFQEARRLARECIRQRPEDAWSYGVLADCETELGNYAAAVEAVQKMIDRKPGLAAYARAGYQRELHGDPEGALEALEMAYRAGSPRDPEALAWCRVMTGQVRFNMGRVHQAEADFARALEHQPEYPAALRGRARCLAALGRFREAATVYRRALRRVYEPAWAIELGDVLARLGDHAGARREYRRAFAFMQKEAPIPEHDREIAFYLAEQGNDPKRALFHARRAARARRDIRTWDTLAWALFRNGRYAEAWRASEQARRLGTRDAGLYYRAARIAARLPGRRHQAHALLRQALAINPHFDTRHAPWAKAWLASAKKLEKRAL